MNDSFQRWCVVALSIALGIGLTVGSLLRADDRARQSAKPTDDIPNELIDASGFLKDAHEAIKLRQKRRLTEDEFLTLSKKPGVIVLDARSKNRFDELHIKGAISLPFTDMSIDSLKKTLPDKNVTILIYCNNNFRGNLPEVPIKARASALNLSTFTSLYSYGYRNMYELGPAVDVYKTKLALVGTHAHHYVSPSTALARK